MIKYFCDLCEAQIVLAKNAVPLKFLLPASLDGRDWVQKDADICDACFAAIKETVESLRKSKLGDHDSIER